MLRVRDIAKRLKIFERNKIPMEVKVLGIATYIQTSSVRRTAEFFRDLFNLENISLEGDKEV